MALSLAIGVLTAGGLYLLMQRELVRIVFGFLLISHAVNLLLLAAGVTSFRLTPLLGTGDTAEMADPLPQAFVLTSIVIAVATAIYMLTLTVVGQRATRPHASDRTDVADQEHHDRDDLGPGSPVTGDPTLDDPDPGSSPQDETTSGSGSGDDTAPARDDGGEREEGEDR